MVTIDYSRDKLLSEFAITTLKDRYMTDTEASPQDAFARAATAFADDEQHAQRLYDYASKHWFMFSTPILANGGTARGLPISCFLNDVDDSRRGLSSHYDENIWLSSSGGGIGGNWSKVRSQGTSTSIGNNTTGVIPFLHVVDAQMLAFNQGATRRGSYAAFMDISHPEITEFLQMRRPTGGDVNRKNLNLHHGINITDDFMRSVEAGGTWDLIDPHTGTVINTVKARDLWIEILTLRVETGEPYLFFIDTANTYLPEQFIEAGLKINHTNLCTEIMLPTDAENTAVCCLSSVNLAKWDAWSEDRFFIEDLMRMLDNVLEYFEHSAPPELHRAVATVIRERNVGLGAMGFHSLLQQKGVPFEGAMANSWNRRVFGHLHAKVDYASTKLGAERGSAPIMDGHCARFGHTMAVAPNASSSIICGGTSPSIEPLRANAYVHKTKSGSFLVKNPELENVLREILENSEEVWQSIITNKGSVQHLKFLSDEQKEIFKTAVEIDQMWIIEHASDRQKYIDQGQSVNLFFPADVDKVELHAVHMAAWKKDLKSLYYCRSEAIKRAEIVSSKVEREVRKDYDECMSCQG